MAGGITETNARQSALIFVETIRDSAISKGFSFADGLARTTIHEIGHQLKIATTPDTHRPNADNIMYGGGTSAVPDAQFYFHPDDVAYLRFAHLTPGSR